MLCSLTQFHLERNGYFICSRTTLGTYPRGHYHGGIELMLLHSGAIDVGTGNWRSHAVPGQIVAITGGDLHWVRPLHGKWTRTIIHIMEDFTTPSIDLISDIQTRIQQRGGGYTLSLPGPSLERFFWAARSLYKGRKIPRPTVWGLLTVILSEFLEASDRELAHSPPQLINEIVAYMKTHPEATDSIDDLSQRFHISPRHLHRLFQDYVAYTPHEFWLEVKIDKARQLLKEESMSIEEVGNAIGFESRRGFERAFRKLIHFSPSQYRQSIISP